MSSCGTSSGLADDGVGTENVDEVLGLAITTTWEKRDLLTDVKCKGGLQLRICESVVFVSRGKFHALEW
jgi:hypothetical protein